MQGVTKVHSAVTAVLFPLPAPLLYACMSAVHGAPRSENPAYAATSISEKHRPVLFTVTSSRAAPGGVACRIPITIISVAAAASAAVRRIR